jgi:hypothetical protein
MSLYLRASLIWCGFFVLAMINGALREVAIKRMIDEPWAHHLSALTAIILFGIYAWAMRFRLDLRSDSDAVFVGALWLILTFVAETLIVGRLMGHHSWPEIFANYNIAKGNLWPLVLIWVTTLPFILRRTAPSAQ